MLKHFKVHHFKEVKDWSWTFDIWFRFKDNFILFEMFFLGLSMWNYFYNWHLSGFIRGSLALTRKNIYIFFLRNIFHRWGQHRRMAKTQTVKRDMLVLLFPSPDDSVTLNTSLKLNKAPLLFLKKCIIFFLLPYRFFNW